MRKNEHWENYIRHLKAKGLSNHTIIARDRALKKFILWLNTRGFTVQDAIEEDIHVFKASMEKLLKPNSVLTHLRSIKSFYQWMANNSLLMVNPMEHFEAKVAIDKLPEILTHKEVEKLFDSLPTDMPTAKRNRAMLELAYSALLRREELVNIKISDIDLRNNTVRVDRKGNVEALVPFGDIAKAALVDYLYNERNPISPSEYLWLDYKSGEHLSYNSVDSILKQIRKQTAIKLSMHTLRRSGATHMLQNGASLQVIQEMLSHTTLKAVKHYLRLNTKDYHETLKKSELLK